MIFFKTRAEVAELRKQVEALTRAMVTANQTPSYDPNQILAIAMDGQAKQLGSTSDFIRMVHEIALERYASSMGRRGGKRRAASAQRDAKGRMLPARKVNQTDCVLCDDPQTADFSIAQFEAHQAHKNRGRSQRAVRETREESEEMPFETVATPAEAAPAPARTYPLPYVERETGGAGSGSSAQDGESAAPDSSNLQTHIH